MASLRPPSMLVARRISPRLSFQPRSSSRRNDMRSLNFDHLNPKVQKILSLVLAIALLLSMMSLLLPARPALGASASCSAWYDTGQCCYEGWPSWSRDYRYRNCSSCTWSGCRQWTEYSCAYWSSCP